MKKYNSWADFVDFKQAPFMSKLYSYVNIINDDTCELDNKIYQTKNNNVVELAKIKSNIINQYSLLMSILDNDLPYQINILQENTEHITDSPQLSTKIIIKTESDKINIGRILSNSLKEDIDKYNKIISLIIAEDS